MICRLQSLLILLSAACIPAPSLADGTTKFFAKYCIDCHGQTTQEASLDLESLAGSFTDPNHFRLWVKVYDRIAAGEMPPRDAAAPPAAERTAALQSIHKSLVDADHQSAMHLAALRRLTRSEYENTIRDLFAMPGIALAGNLPADGSAHGFDKHPDALDLSHVNVAKYLEAADHILDYAIATRPAPPQIHRRRISLVNRGGFVAHITLNGDAVLLKNKQIDPDFPPAADQSHLDEGAHERWGSFRNGASVGIFRHEDESVSPYFSEHVTIYPAHYRLRTSLWSFQWDQGKVLPSRGTEAARLSAVQLTGDGRGGQHPSYTLGYFDAPDTNSLEHELVVWLNHNEMIGFNAASLAPAANYYKKRRAMEFTGPGIAVDWLDIEGPLHECWPPKSHQLLFGDLPIIEFKSDDHPGVRPPGRIRPRQIGSGMNRLDPEPGVWTVHSDDPLGDADRLLANFLPKLFRRPVPEEARQTYLEVVSERLAQGDCFETAMRAAYRNALVAPDFLYHVEQPEKPDDHALACRLSYFFWNSLPDEQLASRAEAGDLRDPQVLHGETRRLLADPRSRRFIDNFVGQWLKLREIAATDPDNKLYPEFSPYQQDSMVAETREYFRELLNQDLDASHLVKSPFVMVNQKLATHYGIPNVSGSQIRRVPLPEDCPRGGFLTQASILKITSNGTTTSPVPRGAFVLDRLLGQPPEPPPANVAAIEPDVRGTTTIRQQLAKHREQSTCASCHLRIDPPGFALESFDVIGGFRDRYRSIGEGDPAPRGAIDPMIGIGFRLGPQVDPSGQLTDGRAFADIRQFQELIAADSTRLLRNLAERFTVYATGRTVRFSDRETIEKIIQRTEQKGGGIRTLLHELVASPLLTGQASTIEPPDDLQQPPSVAPDADLWSAKTSDQRAYRVQSRLMMAPPLAGIPSPVVAKTSPETAVQPSVVGDSDEEHPLKLSVVGLFIPERADDFRKLMQECPEAQLIDFDVETASATIVCARQNDAPPEQMIQSLDNRVRHLSDHTFGLKSLSTIPREELERIEIPIIGLDCKACSFAVYQILAALDGVEQATANFHDGLAVAWIDTAKTDLEAIRTALTARGVQLSPKDPAD
jgi:copper chaperone CopZ